MLSKYISGSMSPSQWRLWSTHWPRDPFFCHQGMVIDEAQKIKNHGALVSKAVKEVGNAIGHTRIALSGAMVTCGAGRRWRWWEVRVGGLTLVSWFLLLCVKPIIFCLRRSLEEDFAWLNQHRTGSNVNGQLRSQRVKLGGNHGIYGI